MGCTWVNIASQSRQATLFYSALVRHIQFWSPWYKTDMEILEQIWKKAMEHLSYEGRLRELGLLRLEKKRVRRDLINVFKYLIGGVKKLKSHSSQ